MKHSVDSTNLTGQKFSFWTVLNFDKIKNRKSKFICKCKCGIIKSIYASNLKRKMSTSCGCSRQYKYKYKYGTKSTIHIPEYYIWSAMIQRCTQVSHKSYKNYGGRGITICKRWLKGFKYFYQDMGDRPNSKLTIERINNNKGYKPSNCKWATRAEQMHNKRIRKDAKI